MKTEDLPDLFRGELDDAALSELMADFEAVDELEVQLKADSRTHAQDRRVDLGTAREALLRRKVRGAQFVYLHKGVCWIDTVICVQDRYILVRIEHS